MLLEGIQRYGYLRYRAYPSQPLELMAFFCVWASLTSNIPQNIILHAEGHQTLADAKLINTVAVANFKQVPAAMRFLPTSQLNYVDPLSETTASILARPAPETRKALQVTDC